MTQRSRTVVVVEDDASVRGAIVSLLDAAGLECTAFASAEDCLAADIEGAAACVVSDWRMPGVSGLGLLEAMRERGAKTPLILITAHDAHGMREEAERRGAAAYLVKPFRGAELLGLIRSLSTDLGTHPRT